ncbi:hypothetical protein R0595_001359 [Pluralibacter gergoviae]|nr:hypothetical protein [Pluralibacter gergoviae]ELW9440914.1 hypothetical protein [Pluralibacter gergoviae]
MTSVIKFCRMWLAAAMTICLLANVPFAQGANSAGATLNFKATVLADCFISISPSSLDFGNVNASELAGKTIGTEISGHSKSFTITPQCYGTDKFKVTYKSTSYDGASSATQCAADSEKVMMFCLKKTDNSSLYMSNGTGSFTQSGGNTAFDLNALLARGSGNITPGTKTASIELTISPE